MAEQAPGVFNWVIRAGDGESRSFSFYEPDNDDGSQGAEIVITGRTYRAEFRTTRGETGTAAATATCTITATNTVKVSLTSVQTRALADAGRRYFWDLEETVPGNDPVTIIEGTARTRQDTTR